MWKLNKDAIIVIFLGIIAICCLFTTTPQIEITQNIVIGMLGFIGGQQLTKGDSK